MTVRDHQLSGVHTISPPGSLVGDAALELVFPLTVAAGATGDLDWDMPWAARVTDVWALKTENNGGAGDSVQLQTGAGAAISGAIDLNTADTNIRRGGAIDDATAVLAQGAKLRVRRVQAVNAACIVYVKVLRTG